MNESDICEAIRGLDMACSLYEAATQEIQKQEERFEENKS